MKPIASRLWPTVLILASCTAASTAPPVLEAQAEAVLASDLDIWVPKSTLTSIQGAQGREALQAAGLPVYLVLPGQVLVTAAAATSPTSDTFERLSGARTWSTRATSTQSRSAALARSLLLSAPRPSAPRGFVDHAFPVEDQLAAARESLEAERAATHQPVTLRRIDRDLAALDVETAALTAVPIAGTPAHSRRKYLRGSILIYCLFVESTGTGNEDWTSTEVTDALAEYAASLLEFARVAPVEYALSFTLDHLPPTDPRMSIAHEPTDGVPERRWIVEVVRNLGYNGVVTAAGGTQRLERDLIEDHGVREATVVYVARDAAAPFATFSGSDVAWPHAWFNSYAITNSAADGPTFVHEVLHTFNAEDEYSDPTRSGYGCRARSSVGHDRAVAAGSGPDSNANQVDCHPALTHQACMMNFSGSSASTPFERPVLCWHSRAQIGWRDTAAVRVRLTGLPAGASPNQFTPSLLTHLDGRATALTETFSYVEEGSVFFGGRRCTVRNSTQQRFTATGDVVSCPLQSFAGVSVTGGPDDLRVGGEGRVREVVVPYTATAEQPCGDGVCDLTETAASCALDCGCGNESCDLDESVVSCPVDCAICGDDACTPGETRANCPEDCGLHIPVPEGP